MINREIIYERDMMGSYMKIAAGPAAGMDEKLMMKKKLPGTLSVEKNFVDGKGQYWYLISGKQSLDTYCKMRKIDAEFMERLVISICSQLEILEWNLIKTNCLMLDPELVFVANGSREFIFTLYPGGNSRPEVEFQQLMEFLLTKLDHTNDASVQAAYALYERTLEDGYSILDVREMIMQRRRLAAENADTEAENARPETMSQQKRSVSAQKPQRNGTLAAGVKVSGSVVPPAYNTYGNVALKPEGTATMSDGSNKKGFLKSQRAKTSSVAKVTPITKSQRAQTKAQKILPMTQSKAPSKVKTQAAKVQSVPFTERLRKKFPGVAGYFMPENKPRNEVIYPDEEIYVPQQEQIHETICISDYRSAPRGVLMYEGANGMPDIELLQDNVKIGYAPEADVRIMHDTISHIHAKIDRKDDAFYIEDLNSTNGTFINDEPLAYKERRQLNVNDVVRFADVRYRFG